MDKVELHPDHHLLDLYKASHFFSSCKLATDATNVDFKRQDITPCITVVNIHQS